jgi:hypothetical protein
MPDSSQEPVHERETARLAAERTAAQPIERRLRVVVGAVEVHDDAPARALAVVADRPKDRAPQVLDRLEVGDLPRPQLVGQRELRPRLEPAGEVVSPGVVGEALRRERLELLGELPQVPRPGDLPLVRHPEDEISEAQVLAHEEAKLLEERRRSLLEERSADRARQLLVLRPAGLQHHRHVGLPVADAAARTRRRPREDLAVLRELDVGDDAEDVLFVGREIGPRLLEGPREKDLRLGLKAHQAVREVDPFGDQVVRVVHQLRIDRRQERGVVADVVFDDEDRLDAEGGGVVGRRWRGPRRT